MMRLWTRLHAHTHTHTLLPRRPPVLEPLPPAQRRTRKELVKGFRSANLLVYGIMGKGVREKVNKICENFNNTPSRLNTAWTRAKDKRTAFSH